MGNSSTKEASRGSDGPSGSSSSGGGGGQRVRNAGLGAPFEPATSSSGADRSSGNNRRARVSRTDLSGILGIGPGGPSSHSGGGSHGGSGSGHAERRETKQEREAKKLEKERMARLKERERSLREEHVDGGYLVTLGTYIGPEDFSKPVVRQLQVILFPKSEELMPLAEMERVGGC
jgi:hypothetical protein